MSSKNKFLKIGMVIFLLVGISAMVYFKLQIKNIGEKTDELNGVIVYYNGINYAKSYGRHYGADGFYYGHKWQCVEFIKRYYHDYMHHTMPDGMGNANDFFDKKLKPGQLNKQRNLNQYFNGGDVKPAINDIVVFDGGFGHVCIISSVSENEIEVVQQNIFGKPRQKFELHFKNGCYSIGNNKMPLGWLHKPNAF